MKKLLFSLSIITTLPTFSAIPSQDPVANAEELAELRAENAAFKKREAERHARIKNYKKMGLFLAVGGLASCVAMKKCYPRTMEFMHDLLIIRAYRP